MAGCNSLHGSDHNYTRSVTTSGSSFSVVIKNEVQSEGEEEPQQSSKPGPKRSKKTNHSLNSKVPRIIHCTPLGHNLEQHTPLPERTLSHGSQAGSTGVLNNPNGQHSTQLIIDLVSEEESSPNESTVLPSTFYFEDHRGSETRNQEPHGSPALEGKSDDQRSAALAENDAEYTSAMATPKLELEFANVTKPGSVELPRNPNDLRERLNNEFAQAVREAVPDPVNLNKNPEEMQIQDFLPELNDDITQTQDPIAASTLTLPTELEPTDETSTLSHDEGLKDEGSSGRESLPPQLEGDSLEAPLNQDVKPTGSTTDDSPPILEKTENLGGLPVVHTSSSTTSSLGDVQPFQSPQSPTLMERVRAVVVSLDMPDECIENQEQMLRQSASAIKAALAPIDEERKNLGGERQKLECLLVTLKADLSNKLQTVDALKQKVEDHVKRTQNCKDACERLSASVIEDTQKLLEAELRLRELQIALLKTRMAHLAEKSPDGPLQSAVFESEKKVESVEAEIRERQKALDAVLQALSHSKNESRTTAEEESKLHSAVAAAEVKTQKAAESVVSTEKKLKKVVDRLDVLLEQHNQHSWEFVNLEKAMVTLKMCRRLKSLDRKQQKFTGPNVGKAALELGRDPFAKSNNSLQYATQVTYMASSNSQQQPDGHPAGVAGQHFSLQAFSTVHNSTHPGSSQQLGWAAQRLLSAPFPADMLSASWNQQQS